MFFSLSKFVNRQFVPKKHGNNVTNLMSLLAGKTNSRKPQKLPKILPGSVNFHCLLLGVTKPKISKLTNKLGPRSISIVTLQEETVPYVFRAPTAAPGQVPRNQINAPLVGVPPLVIPPLGKTTLIPIFDHGEDLIIGEVYRLEGVFLDAYKGVVLGKDMVETMLTEPEIRPSCARLTLETNPAMRHRLDDLPFELRSFSRERDIPGDDRIHYAIQPSDYRFVHVKIVPKGGSELIETQPGTLQGYFLDLVPGNTPEMVYAAYNKEKAEFEPEVKALTGGRSRESVDKAQFGIQQNEPTGKSYLFKALTRVYENAGLRRFQLDWVKMGAILTPNIIGDAFCTIDRDSSKDIIAEPEFDGVVAVNMSIVPDMEKISKRIGFKITWDSFVKLSKVFNDKEAFDDLAGFRLETAVNILRYPHNLEFIRDGAEEGWIEFYVITNLLIDDDAWRNDLKNMEQDKLISELTNKKYYGGAPLYFGVFAVCTGAQDGHISDYISPRGDPPAAEFFGPESKRAKVSSQ